MKRLGFFLVLVMLAGLFAGCVTKAAQDGSGSWTEGICLIADNGQVVLIADGQPIALSDRSKEGDLLNGLQTGDRIRVLHNGIAENYPAQAGIYKLERTGQGSIDDIPAQTLDQLRSLGWIS